MSILGSYAVGSYSGEAADSGRRAQGRLGEEKGSSEMREERHTTQSFAPAKEAATHPGDEGKCWSI